MQKQIKHIFIAIAPNHILNFESIITSNNILEGTLLLNPGNYSYNSERWTVVIKGEIDLNYKVSKTLQKLKYQKMKLFGYKQFVKKTKASLSFVDAQFCYYYCNLDDILSNHFFYFFKEGDFSVKNYVVEDGILNYYYPNINKTKLKSKKVLMELLLGIKFKPQDNHPTRINSTDVTAQYVRLPKKSICPDKSLQLPFKKIEYNPDIRTILIIGQDIMHNNEEGLEYYEKRLDLLIDKVRTLDLKQANVVYKPHRNGDYSIAVNKLQKVFPKFQLFNDDTPIEECIVNIKPLYIYSFESSAMLNLKIAIENQSVKINVLPYNNNNKNLIEIFRDLGINILE